MSGKLWGGWSGTWSSPEKALQELGYLFELGGYELRLAACLISADR